MNVIYILWLRQLKRYFRSRTRMIGSLGQQLNGQVELTYAPSGFIYALDVPLGSLAAGG